MPKKIPFTDAGVRALKAPSTGQTTVWDSRSPIGVRISQGGAKAFVVMMGSGKRHTIGRVGIVTLSDAREEAKRLLAQKTLKLVKKQSPVNFETALKLYLEQHFRGKRPRTVKEATRLLNKHFLPPFRRKLLSDLEDRDIEVELAKLSGTPSEQLHAFRAVRTMLKWTTRPPRRYIAHSPLEGYQAPGKDRKGTRVLSETELVKLWGAREDAPGDLIRLMILWGTRNTETAVIERAWVDDGMLTIPGEYTKNHRAHSIPLLPMAIEILERQPAGGKYYFPGRVEGTHIAGWSDLKETLDEKCGFSDWQFRDIRRTFRTNLAKLRVPREVAEILVNHVTGGDKNELDEIYNRYDYEGEKREALAKWEDKLTELLART